MMLSNEDVFKGGAALGVAGGVFQSLKSGPARLWGYFQAKLYLTCVIESEEPLFPWVLMWLSQHSPSQHSGSLRVVTEHGHDNDGEPHVHRRNRTNVRIPMLVHGDGTTILRFAKARFLITINTTITERGDMFRIISIRCLKRHRAILQRIFEEAAALEREPDSKHTRIMLPQHANPGYWWQLTKKKKRADESVILPAGMLERTVSAVLRFFASDGEYADLGIPHRFGILLSGPPGNGKSTLALTIAAASGSPSLYVLPLGDHRMTDSVLIQLLSSVPEGGVVVIEDIDAVFTAREQKTKNVLTFSGLLNAIDGPTAGEGRLLILTTNHPERLDPALIRAGRVDLHLVLPNATEEQARRMWRRFAAPGAEEEAFVQWAGDGSHSMAELQDVLLQRPAKGSPRVGADVRHSAPVSVGGGRL